MKPFKFPKIEGKFVVWSFFYLVLLILLRWRLTPNITILLFVFGAIIGIFILDVMEKIIDMKPSPLGGALAQMILLVLTFFSITSTGNLVGKGVVLFLNLKYLYLARNEFLGTGNLTNWFKQINMTITPKRAESYLLVFTIIIIMQAAMFILL